MRYQLFQILAVALGFMLLPGNVLGQAPAPDTSLYVVVHTANGHEFVGKVLSTDAETVVLSTENFGQITLQRSNIRRIRPIKNFNPANPQAWLPNPYSSRHFVSQNAYGMQKGEGLCENGWLFFNQVAYGLSDQFSMRLGFAPLFIVEGPLPFWAEPKFSVPLLPERLHLSVGGILGHGLSDFDGLSGNFGALYSQLTLGPRDANLTAGFGYGFSDGGWSKGPGFSLAGQLRTGRKFALLSENYFFFSDDADNSVWSVGGRFMGRYVAVDVALLMLISPSDGTYPIPWLGLRVPFGS